MVVGVARQQGRGVARVVVVVNATTMSCGKETDLWRTKGTAYSCCRCKRSSKKHKTWEGDGKIFVSYCAVKPICGCLLVHHE